MILTKLKHLLTSIADFRRGIRLLTGQSKLDVVFICHLRDEVERADIFKPGATALCQDNGPRLYIKNVAGQICSINFTAEEMAGGDGRKLAKQSVISAVEWAERQGAKVVLLSGPNKSLFGRDGRELKQLFPSMLFTLGDNGAALLLCADVDRALRLTGLTTQQPRILVLGCAGIPGRTLCAHLQAKGLQVLGFDNNHAALEIFRQQTGLPVFQDLLTVGPVDLVVACPVYSVSHPTLSRIGNQVRQLTPTAVAALRRSGRKLLVIDMAVPTALEQPVYQHCQSWLARQDGGNGFARGLHFVLGKLSYCRLRLSPGSIFGDCAEAMALFHAVYHDHNHLILNRDWFEVSPYNQALLAEAFYSLRIGLSNPHSFGAPVTDFELALNPMAVARTLVNTSTQPNSIEHSAG